MQRLPKRLERRAGDRLPQQRMQRLTVLHALDNGRNIVRRLSESAVMASSTIARASCTCPCCRPCWRPCCRPCCRPSCKPCCRPSAFHCWVHSTTRSANMLCISTKSCTSGISTPGSRAGKNTPQPHRKGPSQTVVFRRAQPVYQHPEHLLDIIGLPAVLQPTQRGHKIP